MDDRDLRDYAARFYAPVLYQFIKQHIKITYKIDGDDGTGHEPFEMSDRLFYVPACMICSRPEEMVSDRFGILLKKEVCILEDGRAASVYCMNFEKDGWKAIYRFLDKYIRDPCDLPVPFEELAEGLVHMMQAVEGDETKMCRNSSFLLQINGSERSRTARLWRVSPENTVYSRLFATSEGLQGVFISPVPSLFPKDFAFVLFCDVLLRLAVYFKAQNTRKFQHGREYGSAGEVHNLNCKQHIH